MSTPILATKLYIPPTPPRVVLRPRLIERLNKGLHRKLTLVSAPAGFGKTTLVSAWVTSLSTEYPVPSTNTDPSNNTQSSKLRTQYFSVAWLSLENTFVTGQTVVVDGAL